MFCHNCAQSWSVAMWLKQVCNLTLRDIRNELNLDVHKKIVLDINDVLTQTSAKKSHSLPKDSINIFDKEQVMFYKSYPVIRKALQLVKQRRLHKAINKPKALYVSLEDFVHKNRLCIPFYDLDGKIVYYQTRKIMNDNTPKYLSKAHDEKSIFGIDKIDPSFPYIFVLEGPIDAMFIKNGIAVCGITMTKKQKKQLQQFPTHEIIWCLDNQNLDSTSANKTKELIKQEYKVFVWPKSIKAKDLNDYCIENKINEFDYKIILDNLNTNKVLMALNGFKV